MRYAIFYTNNRHPKLIDLVLNQLVKVSENVKIVTIVDQHIENNPFEEIVYNNPVSNHYNIVQKILEGLKYGHGTYKEVSFLEHDVMYPEGYFDYPPIATCTINTNYIGVYEKGFQQKLPCQLPLHQMSMNMDFAIKHFTKLLPMAKLGSVFVEPERTSSWTCDNPAVHVNHGRNFTSHFTCYSQKDNWEEDKYWGNYKNIFDASRSN